MTKQKKITEVKEKRTFRIKPSDWEQIEKLAEKFAGGNTSAWVRYACLNFRPPSAIIG